MSCRRQTTCLMRSSQIDTMHCRICSILRLEMWQRESLNLKVGDWIIWRDEAIESEDGPAVLSPGMRGQVLSLHDGFHLDVAQVEPIPAKAVVQFENGMRLMVDKRMKWQRVAR